jgi:hypothetical protein
MKTPDDGNLNMNRVNYFNYIEEKLTVLSSRIDNRGKLNILDYHLHSESFYLHFLNRLFDWKLENMNTVKQNVEAIDLIDKNNKIIIQVSATATKQKIESALSRIPPAQKGYTFKFISISKDAKELRTKSYNTPHHLSFNPETDIFDISHFLAVVKDLEIEQFKTIYDFIKKELGEEAGLTKMDSNLTHIINILAQENWAPGAGNYNINEFEIDRKIKYNNLNSAKTLVEDYAIHSNRVDEIYKEFNRNGVNKSSSVLASIRHMYISNKTLKSDDALFSEVINQVIYRIKNSANYTPIPFEELEMCVNILVVDSFIRCKIFENPGEYPYAAAR